MENSLLRLVVAHLSWITAIVAATCFVMCFQLPDEVHRLVTLLEVGAGLLILFGFGCVFFALASPRWYGSGGVLKPAMVGFVLNFLLGLLMTQVTFPRFPD